MLKETGDGVYIFLNKSNGSRHRIILKEADDRYPNPTLDDLENAKYLE